MNGAWGIRVRRAEQLAETRTHANELLKFYCQILHEQASLYQRSRPTDFSRAPADTETVPRLTLSQLPIEDLSKDFEAFIVAVREAAPDVTAEIGTTILAVDPDMALCWFVEATPDIPPAFGAYTRTQLEFYPRGFLQPIAQSFADTFDADSLPRDGVVCPVCGALPQLSLLDDEPDAKGQRRLLCSLCATAWRFPRVTCPNCREATASKLFRHENNVMVHVSIEECMTCRCYVKSIDLRKEGRADPYVDDIATVELDLWARERELTRIKTNLLGF